MDDSHEINIENIEQFIKVEVNENVAFDLTKFWHISCPDCAYVFGAPSKLKRHYFLSHEKILDSELEHFLDMESRVDITLIIQNDIIDPNSRNVEVVDNFLDASLEAKLIVDEIAISAEVESIPLKVLGQILGQYLHPQVATKLKEETMSTEIMLDWHQRLY